MKTPNHCRTGSLLLEVVISAGMLAVALVLIARMNVAMAGQARLVKQRDFASQLLQNEMERFAVLPVAERRLRGSNPPPVNQRVTAILADAKLEAEVEPLTDAPNLQRVTLSVRWITSAGAPPTHLSLSTVFPSGADPSEENTP